MDQFLTMFMQSLPANAFVKLSLGNYQGEEADLRQVLVKRSIIRQQDQLSFTYRYRTRDIVKNYIPEEGGKQLKDLLGKGFRSAYLSTLSRDYQLEIKKDGRSILKKHKPAVAALPEATHDHTKTRLLDAKEKSFLYHLGIANAEGVVLKHAQDKYRQINHYLELLRPLLHEWHEGDVVKVMDMGSGKGYLTFALYDYLKHTLHTSASVTGVEFRQDMVEFCNTVARNNNMEGLQFMQGSIEDANASGMDIVIALHACDTATDEAIFKGIQAGAGLIVVAPCCHKQIRREMEKAKTHEQLDFMLRHGIYLEREAEMLTDSLRALILESFGYSVKVMEFISAAHTPKNIMITARKTHDLSSAKKESTREKIRQAKAFFGIEKHQLEVLLGL